MVPNLEAIGMICCRGLVYMVAKLELARKVELNVFKVFFCHVQYIA